LGVINRLPQASLAQFNQFFVTNTSHDREAAFFKESLRKLRHEIEMSKAQSFLFMSLKEREGKSFVVAALAHALALKHKKVLLIDMNFKNNTLTLLTSATVPKTNLNNNIITSNQLPTTATNATDLGFQINLSEVDIIGNKGGYQSPSELLSGVDFIRKVEYFKTQYDYVFFEVAAINNYSDTRELVPYVEKIIPILDATTKISSKDAEGIAFMNSLNGKMLGAILNKADLKQLS
jgi:Mrp family chromosome partitioning ATPase